MLSVFKMIRRGPGHQSFQSLCKMKIAVCFLVFFVILVASSWASPLPDQDKESDSNRQVNSLLDDIPSGQSGDDVPKSRVRRQELFGINVRRLIRSKDSFTV